MDGQLHPTEQFPITYVLGDPNDTGTYYVRAVIYDDVAGTTIETVDLTDLGGGRFKKNWQVCSDVSGSGRYISIVVKVYTDSGYTTLSDAYQQKENKYLVQERWNRGNLGGAPIVSYKEIRKIIQEEMGKIPKTEFPKFPEQESFQPITDAIISLRNDVKNIPVPEKPEKTDFSPALERLDRIKKAVEAIYVPETDLSPVLSELKRINPQSALDSIDELIKKMGKFFLDDVEDLKDALRVIQKQIEEKTYIALKSKDEKEIGV